jgi:hypothetical protein
MTRRSGTEAAIAQTHKINPKSIIKVVSRADRGHQSGHGEVWELYAEEVRRRGAWPEDTAECEALCGMSRARSSRRDPIADLGHTATAAGAFRKKNNRRPGPTIGQDSPDRRQWIKSGPKVRASTRRWHEAASASGFDRVVPLPTR